MSSKRGSSGRTGRGGGGETIDFGDDSYGERTTEYAQDNFSAWQASWSAQERDAIETYQSEAGFLALNGAARGERPMTPDVASATASLDAALSRSRLKDNLILYRGANSNAFQNVKPGDVIHDAGYMSTSTFRGTAEMFSQGFYNANQGRDENVIFRISAPRGTRGGYIDNPRDSNNNAEVLLARNTRLRVTGVSMRPASSRDPEARIIEAEIV